MKHRRKDADTTVGTTIEGGPFAVSFFWITLVFFFLLVLAWRPL